MTHEQRRRFTCFRRAITLATGALALSGMTAPLTGEFDERVLGAHNRERAQVGLAPLNWDPQLARDAASWATTLAHSGRFDHAPIAENDTNPQGENLWAGTPGYFSPEAMVNYWIKEKADFKPGRFPNNSRLGNWERVGHYTQLMWRSTHKVGCALAKGHTEDILVCRYSEGGNVVGEDPF